jgi:hypothetical protein
MPLKKIKFNIINVKLKSNKKDADRLAAYEHLITSLTRTAHFTRLGGNEAITMYKPYNREENGVKYYYGTLGKGISFFDKDEIRVLSNDSVSKEIVDKNRILEPKTADYLFIPSIHRFAIVKKANSISVNEFEKFLREHLVAYIGTEEKIDVDSEKEPSIIDEIFKAAVVYKLSYEISYTNSDALKAQGQLFDELLKENNIGRLTVIAESDHNTEGMNIDNVDFLGGGIEVARNNGVIKNAKILTEQGTKVKTVYNADKPLVEELEVLTESDNVNQKWFRRLLNLY